MPVLAKICGLSDPASVDVAVRGGAAWLGFVMFARSPRDVAPEQAGALAERAPGAVGRVAVLVNPDDALAARAAAAGMTALQLHGSEPPERVAALKAATGLEVWKAIPVRTRRDIAAADLYRDAADRILFDARTPDDAALPGGMGLRFDWRLLDGVVHRRPWLLSGGLDPASVAEAVGVTGARAVDVSSGVESAPGVKAVDKIAAFLQATGRL